MVYLSKLVIFTTCYLSSGLSTDIGSKLNVSVKSTVGFLGVKKKSLLCDVLALNMIHINKLKQGLDFIPPF